MPILVILFLKIIDTRSYVPVITLSARDNQKLSKLLGKGFESSLLEEYKKISENKDTTNAYRYSPEPNFVGVNRLFVLVYKIMATRLKDLMLKNTIYQKV